MELSFLKLLPKNFFDNKKTALMLKFYALKQYSLGMKINEVNMRLDKALLKLDEIFILKNENQSFFKEESGSFCFI